MKNITRPSKNTDKEFIEVALEMLPETGCSGLSLRVIAKKAKVNLGMFYYHFGSKKEFIRVVLQEVYERFFKGFEIEANSNKTHKELALEYGVAESTISGIIARLRWTHI